MDTEAVQQLIRQIRGAFQDLRAYADQLHADTGVNASMRAVLEYLSESPAATVPQIARQKNVSRQHIQTIVDTLRERALVSLQDNPAHRRSPLVTLTRQGRATFKRMHDKEAVFLGSLMKTLDRQQIRTAATVIEQLRDELPANKGVNR